MNVAKAELPASSDELSRPPLGEEAEEAMPLPADAKIIFLGGIFFILLLATLYAAAEIVWPLVFAFMISLLLNPLLRVLTRLHVPRVLCALLLVVVVLALVVGLGTAISGPATSWAAKLPDGVPRLLQRLNSLKSLSARLSISGNRFRTLLDGKTVQIRQQVALFLPNSSPVLAVLRAASLRRFCFSFFF